MRPRFILALAYSIGLRLSELTGPRKEHIESSVRLEDGVTCWMAKVVGKGQKKREVQLKRPIMDELNATSCTAATGALRRCSKDTSILATLPTYRDKSPLPGTWDDSLTEKRIHKALKRFFAQAADHISETNSEMAEKVQRDRPTGFATPMQRTHWRRE